MTPADLIALRKSHRPQPTQGRVLAGFHVARKHDVYYIWDSRQTSGYLCATNSLPVLTELLSLEEQSQGAVRTLITGEISPWTNTGLPPTPRQDTYESPATLDLADIMRKAQGTDNGGDRGSG